MKTYIWGVPSRIFHWLLAISFPITFILGEQDEFRNLHFAFGAFVGVLIFFRILYGFFGPKYSHFSDFPIGIKNQIEFTKTFFKNTKHYAGHNPLASLVMLNIFLVGILCAVSGYLLYDSESIAPVFGFDEEFLEEFHEIVAKIFMLSVVLHILGIIADSIFHSKTETLKSIFTGYKNIEAENTEVGKLHKIFSVIWFIVPFIFFFLAYNLKIEKSEHEQEKTEKHEEHEEHENDLDHDDHD